MLTFSQETWGHYLDSQTEDALFQGADHDHWGRCLSRIGRTDVTFDRGGHRVNG